jgi:hypothetical protein
MGNNTGPVCAFGWSLGEGARRQRGGVGWGGVGEDDSHT